MKNSEKSDATAATPVPSCPFFVEIQYVIVDSLGRLLKVAKSKSQFKNDV